MHVHGNHLNPNVANLYSAVAAESAAKAKQAAEVRRKLTFGASKLEGQLDGDAISPIGDGAEEGSAQPQQGQDFRDSEDNQSETEQNKSQEQEEVSDDPISTSTWA
jgi:hypothetical protein